MILKVKKINAEARLPQYARPGDAGMDIFALEETLVRKGEIGRLHTGLSVEVPDGYVGLFWDKSGLSINHGIKMLGGVLDSGFRGELIVGVVNLGSQDYLFEKGHKIIQLLIQPIVHAELVEVEELSDTLRGHGGLGSTGK